MTYKVLDNFLTDQEADYIENLMVKTNDFPWFFNQGITWASNSRSSCDYYFVHLFYSQYNINSNFYYLIEPIIDKLTPAAIIRIKGNLYPSFEQQIEADNHVDYEFDHAGAIYFVNTNNGYTVLEDKIYIESKKNRLLLFQPHIRHRSVSCTDKSARVNINFNFF